MAGQATKASLLYLEWARRLLNSRAAGSIPDHCLGLLSEALKYAYIFALPRLNFAEVYGPFAISVSLMFWAFLSGMLLLTGAHLSARTISPA